MSTLNSVFNDSGPEGAATRLSDLYEVRRRVHRLGIRDVAVNPYGLAVQFYDPRIRATVELTVDPWYGGKPGWYWYAFIRFADGFIAGPMGLGRAILDIPYPRQVVQSYQQEIWYQMRSPGRKRRRRGK